MNKSFTDFFISRPIFAVCVNLMILVAGIASIYSLNIRQYPRSDMAKVIVRTAYVGADSALVRGFVTTPLERVIASADGIDYLESSSAEGVSTITAHLRLNFDVNVALTQIQNKVTQVRNDLPKEAEAPTISIENADNQFASMYISFYSTDLAQNQITDYLMRVVQPRLSSVAGVERADILGARTFAMRIWIDSFKLAAYGMSADDVSRALLANNYLAAIGSTKGQMVVTSLKANTDLRSESEFKDLIVRRNGERLITLGDIAKVELGAENYDQDVRFGGETATFMGVWPLPNANSLEVIQKTREALSEIERELPTSMKLGIPYDATAYIRDALHEVIKTLSETILIVIVVIFLFIGSLRSVLVPIVAIPLSLVGACALMILFGFSINLLSLLAIVLAVGLVVDDAIVMLENIERHVQEGNSPIKAAYMGARELVGPTIAMTITLAAVYTPIAFQGGLTGALFKEFALTLAGAVLVSGFVALTLSPMMSAKVVRAGGEESHFQRRITLLLESIRDGYRKILRRALVYAPGICATAFCFGLAFIPFYLFSMRELAPREDQGIVFGIVQADPNASLDQTTKYADLMHRIYLSYPEYQRSFQLISPNGGFSGMLLSPWSKRQRSAQEIEGDMWGKMSTIPNIRMIVLTPPPLPGGSDFPVEFVLSSVGEPEDLYQDAQTMVGKAFQSGLFMFATTDLQIDLPQSELIVDRQRVAQLGLSLSEIGSQLGTMSGGNYINRFAIQGRSYKVIPQALRLNRLVPEQILENYLRDSDGKLVPLSAVAHIEDRIIPRQLARFQQLTSAKIQGAVPPGVSIDSALKYLEQEAKSLSRSYSVDYAGESRQLRKEGGKLSLTLALSFIMIFLVLSAQLESFRDPFIILLGSAPLALASSLLFVFLGATSLNIYSQIGLVTLVGLIAKNGILIVQFANVLQSSGMSKLEAIIDASSTRLRPILMTSVATVVGHFPLVLASGPGAGARNSIGIVLVAGMLLGTLLTLFVLPAIYLFIAGDRRSESTIQESKIGLDGINV